MELESDLRRDAQEIKRPHQPFRSLLVSKVATARISGNLSGEIP
jgi:hypothetical protein